MSTKENSISINLRNGNEPLFLRAKVWGVAGNHEEIVLSRSENSLPDKANDYIFYTSEIFYKIKGDSSVFVYAPESSTSEPVNKISNVTIKGLKTADEIRDYSINYKRYGLQRISIYEQ
ncbi:hypothetical protein GCM10027516_23130 [Niabella aquatica]